MFLDDELYNHVKSRKVDTAEDIQALINECYRICEAWYKPRFEAFHKAGSLDYKLGTVTLDKMFAFWDSFISKLDKDNYMFTDVFTIPGVSYKERFLSKPELKAIYERGKKK